MVIQEPSLDPAVDMYMLCCKARGLARRTLVTYHAALKELRAFLEPQDRPCPVPTRIELRAFVTELLRRGYARSTISIRMRAIRAFSNFLVREGIVEVSPMAGIEIPVVPLAYPEPLNTAEVRSLLRAARTRSWHGLRNHAMLATFCDTGLRLGELIGLDLADVDVSTSAMRVVKAKGGKQRTVYMGRTLSRSMRKWFAAYPFSQGAEACFCTKDGRRLDQRNVARIVERTAARAGLGNRRVHPHLLRHTFATQFIRNGGDPFTLQRLLGHADLSTTMIYVNLAGRDLQEAQAKASPVDRLSR